MGPPSLRNPFSPLVFAHLCGVATLRVLRTILRVQASALPGVPRPEVPVSWRLSGFEMSQGSTVPEPLGWRPFKLQKSRSSAAAKRANCHVYIRPWIRNVNASIGALNSSPTLDGRRPIDIWARRGRSTSIPCYGPQPRTPLATCWCMRLT